MSKFLIIFAGLLFVQLSTARVTREAPVENGPTQTLAEMANKVDTLLKDFNAEFLKFVGVKSNEELVEKVQTQTKTYVDEAKVQFDELAKQINNEKTQQFVSNVKKQLDDLIKEDPAVTADAKSLNEKLTAGAQKLIKDTERFGARMQTEGAKLSVEAEKLLKTIVTTTGERAKQFTAAIQQ